jgi:adenylosuccinate synthase
LDGFKEIKIAVAHDVGGKRFAEFPIRVSDVSSAKPVYEKMKGFARVDWRKVVREGAKHGFEALPNAALAYVRKIESLAGTRVASVSVGPRREDIVFAK